MFDVQPYVSIIIPLYQSANYIIPCLTSILEQDFKDFEIVLVEDGYTDNSMDKSVFLFEKFAFDSYTLIRNKENKGVGAARNDGLVNAKGRYVLFVDSDDEMLPTMLTTLFVEAECCHASMVICQAEEYDSEYAQGKLMRFPAFQGPVNSKDALLSLFRGEFDAHMWKILCKRSLFDEGLRFPAGVIFEEMFVLPYLIEYSNEVVFLPRVLYRYIRRQGSLMQKVNNYHLKILPLLKEMEVKLSVRSIPELENSFYLFTCRIIANMLLNIVKFASEPRDYKRELIAIRVCLKDLPLFKLFLDDRNKLIASLLVFRLVPFLYIAHFRRK